MECMVVGCIEESEYELTATVKKIKIRGVFCENHYKVIRDADDYKITGRKLKR